MSDKKTITINDKEFNLEDFSEEQQLMYAHVQDLQQKVANATFTVDQLRVSQDAFVSMLFKSLTEEVSE